jgi:chromosome segregation ATPase
MAAFDAEKKYKKNLEALKNEIEEKNREAQGLRTEVKICHDRYNRLDQERKNLEAKLVDKHTKPPRETSNEALAFGQAQELKQLKEQLNYAQDENTKLNKTIDVQLKSEINRLSQEKDDLQEKISELKGQIGHLNTVINRIHG